MNKFICLIFMTFWAVTVIASEGDIQCKNGPTFKMKKLTGSNKVQYYALVEINSWFNKDGVITIVPEKDIDTCSFGNKEIIVGGANDLYKVNSSDMQPIEGAKHNYEAYSCFCKLNTNVLEGCKFDEGDTYLLCDKKTGNWIRNMWSMD